MADYLENMSEQHTEKLLPNTIVLLIAAVFGIFGNSLVLLLYSKYIKDETLSRYFIPVLAFVDLVGCISNAVHFLLDNTMSYNYLGISMCKTMYVLIVFTGGLSGHLILAIALQRYLIICRPFGQQMTNRLCRTSILIMFLISFGYSSPSLKLFGKERELNVLNVSRSVVSCRAIDASSKGNQAMILYFGVLIFIILVNIFGTSTLYIPVIRTMYRTLSPARPKNRNYRDRDVNTPSAETRISDVENITMEELPENDVRGNNTEHSKSIDDKNRKQTARQRITVMFLVIIIFYVVSHLTALITQIYSFVEPRILSLTGYKLNILFICLRFNLLNHIANPYIYWFFDIKFRHELRMFCCHGIFRVLKKK